MIRFARLSLPLFAGFVLLAPSAQAKRVFSDKLSVRTDNGILWNRGTLGGTTTASGGLSINYLLFFADRFCAGFGYQAIFDPSIGQIPLYGLDFGVRYYFLGIGTRTKVTAFDMTTEKRDQLSFYVVFGSRQNNLLTTTVDATGTSRTAALASWNLNQGLGIDYRLTHDLDLTGELNASLVSFADQSDRVRLSSFLFKIGLNVLW